MSRSASAHTPDTPVAVRALIAHPGSELLLAEAEDRALVGTLIVGWDGWRGNMYRLVVSGTRRRRGVARRLVQAGEMHLREVGAPRVTALVGRDQEDASKMWRALGYELDEKVHRFVRDL
jgi:ribosomal protein S18 acetylase RimI-like enzyme